MEDCDYCGASFDDEEAYLDHLGSEHEGELSRIDQKRVERAGSGAGGPTISSGMLLGAGAVLVLAGVFYFAFLSGSSVKPDGIEAKPLPNQGNQTLLQDVETYENLTRDHVSTGTDVNYDTVPPVGGNHWPASEVRQAGFYEKKQPYEALVHNLEHGHVVIYYDESKLTKEAERSLKEFAAAHTGRKTSVVVVPNPEKNPEAAYVLTAWGHRLRMDDHDPKVVRAFLAEYLGRGPEGAPAR